ncbi:RNA polymerase sigma factor [Bacillus pinisoli]|uniref:RNA polymerase sigma factor n=1 Tax=Bacillus pinisoli TaxID=2901866 RepID=UPI001FF2FB81|nr:RNA polymerase sigma factor [Bacillus pinisoli]
MITAQKIDREQELLDLYSLYSDSILKYITMMIKDYHRAEDLTHETFIRAFNKLNQGEQMIHPKTWLFSIARNITIDYMRRQNKYRSLLNLFQSQIEASNETERMYQIREESVQLYKALTSLKESHREVIILRKIKEFSILETCQILGWSESKVKNTLARGLKVLETKLLKEGIIYEENR